MSGSQIEGQSAHKVDRNAWSFALVTAFLATMGVGIISPVVPFLVQPYVPDAARLAPVVGLLISAYSICQFFAAPGLGALSDHYGRRPILLICLLGSVVGYLLFGMGGMLWILFLGRIIDGLTGGNLSILHAYMADITPPEKRGQYFGKLGAATGVGFICGPLIGAVAANFGYPMPLYVGAALTFANMLWGYFFMPESLTVTNRIQHISLAQLNPFKQLRGVFALGHLRWLLVAIFLHTIPFAILAGNFALLAKDAFNWQPWMIGTLLFAFGVQDALNQGLFLQRLLPRFGEARVAVGGLFLEIIGYTLIAIAARIAYAPLLIAAFVVFGFGESSFGPSMGGLISRLAGASEQGRVQGSNHSLQASARIVGPILAGELYVSLGQVSPYLFNAFLIGLTLVVLWQTLSNASLGKLQQNEI